MIRYFLVIFSVLLSTPSFAGSPVIFSGDSVKALKQNFDLNGNVSILSGSVNPTSSATSAPKGSLYLSTSTGKAYRKNDAGSSTNWFDLQNGITALTSDVSASGSGSVTATVNSVGGSTASAVNTATILSNAATNSNTNGAIVKRDGSGNFSATTITANLTGNASGTAASFTGSLTGDVTSTAMATTIGANKVTNSMMSTVSTQTFKGRTSGSTGNVEDLTATQATAILNTMVGDSGSGGTKGLVGAPASGDAAAGKFWKADGTWATPTAGFSNPMTTGGDIIYGGASGVATRLANGSAGQVLTSAGGTSAHTWTSPATQSYELNNIGFSTSVGSNILTVALKQSDGSTDPSAGSASARAGFRNSTAGTGGYVERSVTSALSFSISQASSLGLPAVASYMYFYLIDSNGSGTMKLGAAQVRYDEGSLQTTVAESASVTISNASPGVVTETGHTRNANDPIRFTTTGGLPTGLSVGTTYYVKSPITNSYNVSSTPGGTAIVTSSAGSGTHTVHCFGYRLASDGNYSNVSVRFIGRGLLNEPTPGNWSANSTENSLPLSIAQGQKIYAQYTGNAATVITSNVTNVDYATKVIDSHGVFSGTIFLAPLTGWYSVNTAILLGGAGSAFDIQYYVNGVGSLSQSNGGASSVGRGVGTGFFLNAGDTLTVRLTVGGTLSNSAVAHWISISGQG